MTSLSVQINGLNQETKLAMKKASIIEPLNDYRRRLKFLELVESGDPVNLQKAIVPLLRYCRIDNFDLSLTYTNAGMASNSTLQYEIEDNVLYLEINPEVRNKPLVVGSCIAKSVARLRLLEHVPNHLVQILEKSSDKSPEMDKQVCLAGIALGLGPLLIKGVEWYTHNTYCSLGVLTSQELTNYYLAYKLGLGLDRDELKYRASEHDIDSYLLNNRLWKRLVPWWAPWAMAPVVEPIL